MTDWTFDPLVEMVVSTEKMHNLKVENYGVSLADKTEDFSPEDSLSDSSEGLL